MPYKDINKQREWQRQRQIRVHKQHREIVLEMFGSKCVRCGYDENTRALQLDHIVPVLRKYGTRFTVDGNMTWRELATGKITTENIQILCANCHAIKTYEERHLYGKK